MIIDGKNILGILLIAAGIILFMIEFKALPHQPSDPQKWDDLHQKYYRQIKIAGRTCLLIGLTFTLF